MSAAFPTPNPQNKDRDLAIDYLRAFVIVLVILLHAALAYTSFSTFNATHYYESSAPVVDASRWPTLDLIVLYLDTFMMSLLFLVSGLFALPSLESKGSRGFFVGRLQRLGIPFIVGAALIAPLAFWPSYLLSTPDSPTPYLARFFTADGWPVGPPWFLWVLLVFNGLIALANWKAPGLLAKLQRRPSVPVILLATIMAFLPVNLFIPAYYWVSLGPFDLQPARLLLYFTYFILGMGLGAGGKWRETDWPRYWGAWFVLGLLSFVVYALFLGVAPILMPQMAYQAILAVTFSVSCAGACLGMLGAFRKFVRRRLPLFNDLSANAYAIYLIHYLFVLWLQFALVPLPWPAWVKFFIAFSGGLALSWLTSKLLRGFAAVRRVL
ncbi:MAG: acyltransferase family protein [Chloroflexota bacterium]